MLASCGGGAHSSPFWPLTGAAGAALVWVCTGHLQIGRPTPVRLGYLPTAVLRETTGVVRSCSASVDLLIDEIGVRLTSDALGDFRKQARRAWCWELAGGLRARQGPALALPAPRGRLRYPSQPCRRGSCREARQWKTAPPRSEGALSVALTGLGAVAGIGWAWRTQGVCNGASIAIQAGEQFCSTLDPLFAAHLGS